MRSIYMEEPTEPAMFRDEIDRRSLQLVLGAIPVGVVVVDQELTIQAINPAAEKITGVEAQNALGHPYAEVMETQRREITDPLEEALTTGKTFVNQRFYLRPDEDEGSALPIRHSASVLTDEEGLVVGGVTVFADISRQVTLERQLADQRRYLRDVLRSLPDGVLTTDPDLVIESWNEAAVRLTGISAPDAVGRPCAEVMGPAVAATLKTLLAKGSGHLAAQQAKLTLPNGDTLPIGFSASSIETPTNDHVIGGIVAFRDISEQLAHQRQLAHQKRYLDQVLNLAPYGIFTVDTEMAIQAFNQAAEAMTGFAASFAAGKPYDEIISLDTDGGVDPLPNVVTQGDDVVTRLKLVDAGGRRIPIRYAAAPLTGTDDEIVGAIVIFQDISDIVAAERTKNEFISMVSHELRTPLTSIKGFVTAVLDGRAGKISDKQRHFLSISREQSAHLLDLINDLLDMTQFEAGQIDLTRSRIDVRKLIARVNESVAPLVQRKNLTLNQEIAEELPYIWADEDKLTQVLQNLLSNAVKFTPLDGDISVRAYQDDANTLVLEVSDSGIGISREEQERIFDPFYQVESIQTRKVGGTGLGLTIVHRIVTAHGGRIEVESEEGMGATFRIHLPLKAKTTTIVRGRGDEDSKAPSDDRVVESSEPLHERPARLNPLILIVDDDPSANSLIRLLLEEEGYDVISAETGAEALEMADVQQPDLITLDILMPGMDGFHVLEKLNENPRTATIPVCIVSIIEDKVKGYQLGALEYITKPFESERLLQAIETTLTPPEKGKQHAILIVEDNPYIVELVELILQDRPYEILTAYDGVTALEKLRRRHPDLVLLDIMLPKLDGYEFIRQAKADPNTEDVPIIVVSVRSLEEDINRALRLGAAKYLVKPADGSEDLPLAIEDAVNEMLEESEYEGDEDERE